MERAPLELSPAVGVSAAIRGVLVCHLSCACLARPVSLRRPGGGICTPCSLCPGELDSEEALPEQPYTKEELRAYLASTRQKCHTPSRLTDEQAHRPVEYPWSEGQPISFLELQLYNMRHVQEHAAQLSLFLGQHAIPAEELDWVALAIPPMRLTSKH